MRTRRGRKGNHFGGTLPWVRDSRDSVPGRDRYEQNCVSGAQRSHTGSSPERKLAPHGFSRETKPVAPRQVSVLLRRWTKVPTSTPEMVQII